MWLHTEEEEHKFTHRKKKEKVGFAQRSQTETKNNNSIFCENAAENQLDKSQNQQLLA